MIHEITKTTMTTVRSDEIAREREKENTKKSTLLPELSQPSHVTMEPTRSISEMHVSGQTPIKILVTKNGNQHKMNTPRTIPTKIAK